MATSDPNIEYSQPAATAASEQSPGLSDGVLTQRYAGTKRVKADNDAAEDQEKSAMRTIADGCVAQAHRRIRDEFGIRALEIATQVLEDAAKYVHPVVMHESDGIMVIRFLFDKDDIQAKEAVISPRRFEYFAAETPEYALAWHTLAPLGLELRKYPDGRHYVSWDNYELGNI